MVFGGVLNPDGKGDCIGVPLSAMRRQPNLARAELDGRWLYNELERYLETHSGVVADRLKWVSSSRAYKPANCDPVE